MNAMKLYKSMKANNLGWIAVLLINILKLTVFFQEYEMLSI